MNEVRRYRALIPMGDASHEIDAVTASDYADLEAECERLRASRDDFREALNNLIEAVSVYLNEIADLREALTRIAGEDYEAPHDADNDYISRRKSACITRMRDVARDALAASTGQEQKEAASHEQ